MGHVEIDEDIASIRMKFKVFYILDFLSSYIDSSFINFLIAESFSLKNR